VNEAVKVLTEAITKYNGSAAPLYASRALCFLKLKKPASAIRDADVAIKYSPPSPFSFISLSFYPPPIFDELCDSLWYLLVRIV
jgi:hypothetical protein